MAVSLGAGGVFFADAASPPSSVVMVTPVRVLDTRDPVNVGLNGPFVSAIGQDLQVTGLIATTGGPATVVPTGATGVILNVTVVGATASGFLSVRPADAPGAPPTSNLNFLSGQLVPNAVTVQLPTSGPDAGRIEITYDAYGVSGPTTDVLVDVVGYTVGTAGGSDSRVTTLEAQVADLQSRVATIEATTANSRAVHSAGVQNVTLNTATDLVVRTVTIVPTANGTVIANASGTMVRANFDAFLGRCSITSGSAAEDAFSLYGNVPAGATFTDVKSFAGTRGFDVVKGVAFTVRLVCDRISGSGGLTSSSLTAVFAPN
ncbi:MAG TPA: hypothetical protein VLN74_08280 [Ilumatobacteraceae bacterium]|nr:hypothetical protein [Ilumatobacteraceae bacterium]